MWSWSLLCFVVTASTHYLVPTDLSAQWNSTIVANYQKTCCVRMNFGKAIIKHEDGGDIGIYMCPMTEPTGCPPVLNESSSVDALTESVDLVFNYSSCADIYNEYPNSTSGYYNIQLYNGSVTSVYCDMEGVNCDGCPPVLNESSSVDALTESVDLVFNYSSCADIYNEYPNSTSGYYNIQLHNGSVTSVYCDMEGVNCDGEGGWMRVKFFNMTEPNASCPPDLAELSINGLNICWITTDGCSSTFFSSSVLSLNYTSVCGRVTGYQYGYPVAFFRDINTNHLGTKYESYLPQIYTDGVTITYDNPRKHIWTYTSGQYEQDIGAAGCPCNNGFYYSGWSSPFIGSDYYCESGRGNPYDPSSGFDVLYSGDKLWDGQHCPGIESTCCSSSNMPWFYKSLGESTSSDIELNICGYLDTVSGFTKSVAIDYLELYVK